MGLDAHNGSGGPVRHKQCQTCRDTARGNRAETAIVSVKRARARRTPKPYAMCQRTEQYARRQRGLAALEEIDVPVEALLSRKLNARPIDLVHLPKAHRTRVRTLPLIRLPCERSIARMNMELAVTYGTATATFAHGSFVTDPIKLVRMATLGRQHLVVGGDSGSGFLKLGVTFVSDRGVAKFVALLVADCSEKHPDLKRLNTLGLTPFIGESVGFANIWAVLQHFITMHGAFLHGDWKFLSTVLSHMGGSSNYPCFLCTVPHNHLLNRFYTLRKRSCHPNDMNGMYVREPLLECSPTRIVPLPLHVFLGIGNRIIKEVYLPTFGKQQLDSVLKNVKTVHAPGNGGLSDLHGMSGAELKKWLKRNCDERLFALRFNMPDSTLEKLRNLARWMQLLAKYLLSAQRWYLTDLFVFSHLVDEIHRTWTTNTNDDPFPKLHMLRHCLDFMKRFRMLGRVSESEMESFHGQFARRFNQNHLNLSNDQHERIRRTHADTCLQIVQPKARLAIPALVTAPPTSITCSASI